MFIPQNMECTPMYCMLTIIILYVTLIWGNFISFFPENESDFNIDERGNTPIRFTGWYREREILQNNIHNDCFLESRRSEVSAIIIVINSVNKFSEIGRFNSFLENLIRFSITILILCLLNLWNSFVHCIPVCRAYINRPLLLIEIIVKLIMTLLCKVEIYIIDIIWYYILLFFITGHLLIMCEIYLITIQIISKLKFFYNISHLFKDMKFV